MKLTSLLLPLSLCIPSAAFASSRRAFLTAAAAGSSSLVGRSNSHASSLRTIRHMTTSQSPQDFIESQISSNKVTVFSKTYCPYCSSTKSLLDELKVEYTAVELDNCNDGAAVQQALLEKTGQRTVPNTFIGETWMGGNDKLQAAAKAGTLQKMLGLKIAGWNHSQVSKSILTVYRCDTRTVSPALFN
ncbi:hypothetical protein MPSEU_000321200 [Mayamaea pseudoterrestris]|nr:hypothetical protein MPSEU_000321200 [Mayamaea pseudoterrestris]